MPNILQARRVLMRAPAAAAAGAWSPTDLGSALVAGYTTLRSGTVHTSGGNLTSWDDISANADNLTSAVGNEPAYGATAFSGGPGITFDAANNERMASVAEAIDFGTGAAFAVFMSIIIRNTTESFGRILGFKGFVESDDAGATSFSIFRNGTNDQFDLYNGGTVCSFVPTYDTPLRLAVVADGANARFYINNVAQSSAAFSQAIGPTGTLHIGAYSATGTNNLDGDLRALAFMNRNPSSDERASFDTWLQNPV